MHERNSRGVGAGLVRHIAGEPVRVVPNVAEPAPVRELGKLYPGDARGLCAFGAHEIVAVDRELVYVVEITHVKAIPKTVQF